MQVSRLGFWTRSVVAGVVTLSLATSAVGQRTRLSALERNFEDVLGKDGRRAPGIDLRSGTHNLNNQPQVDLKNVVFCITLSPYSSFSDRPGSTQLSQYLHPSVVLFKHMR